MSTGAEVIPADPGVPPIRAGDPAWVPRITPGTSVAVRGDGTDPVLAVVGCHGGAGASTLARETGKTWGGYAAHMIDSASPVELGYQRVKSAARSPLKTRVRTCKNR